MGMKKNGGKKWAALGMIAVMAGASCKIISHVSPEFSVYSGIRWDMVGYEVLLFLGGYGLAAVMLKGKKKKKIRRDVFSHVG